ncbi:hypothetical protein U8V97_13545 [Priestia filamentosa]|uniref:hypothetical protein n=1 Tax=Priestia filamentosa TaxID=1402861 RepID=UPI003978E40E
MATIQTVTLPANTATVLVEGDGRRVMLQGGLYFIGGSDVDSDSGIFFSGSEVIDLGNVAFGETIYAYSNDNNVITVFYYTAT